MAYEDKMSVSYDAVSKKVTVHFRGEQIKLPENYDTRAEGIKAGEDYCRAKGWQG